MKPLGRKAYGSIAHLPGSRMGPADHHCHEGQARIATHKARDRHDVVIVQEKLDGSNVCVARVKGEILPLTRAGYHANSSPYRMHHEFAKWAALNWSRFDALLAEGERLNGEWLYQAHGTIYDLPHEPFVAFDLMAGDVRTPYAKFFERVGSSFVTAKTIHEGGPLGVEKAMSLLGVFGYHGACEQIEGAVWRVERKGEVDFLCKYVRPDKVDGKYLKGVNGNETEVLNTWPQGAHHAE